MKKLSEFVLGRLVAGALVVGPTYLAVLLLLKGIKSLAGIMKPFAQLLPKWLPADQVLSLLVLLVVCFLIWGGAAHPDRVPVVESGGEVVL